MSALLLMILEVIKLAAAGVVALGLLLVGTIIAVGVFLGTVLAEAEAHRRRQR